MANQDLDAVWIPRIGEKGTRELHHLRRTGIAVMVMPLFAAAAGVLIGRSKFGDVLGVLLGAVAIGIVVAFIRAQMRIAAALSEWYGVKIRGIPKMNPKRFDSWCHARGLHHPDEQVVNGQTPARSLDVRPGHSR